MRREATRTITIQWPPPTYLLRGAFTVRGTANEPNMLAYFLEFRPMIDSVTPSGDNVAWSPATLPAPGPVLNDILGVWDTTTTSDGLYELRLTIRLTNGSALYATVSPLRVENHPPAFALTPNSPFVPSPAPVFPTTIPPFAPTPTLFNPNPTATSLLNANVRVGDSTIYAAMGALLAGQQAPILGRSSTGSGWWLIELPDGRTGWIAPSVVQVSGDVSRLPFISPPMPTATPTPIPTSTPTATPFPLPDATITDVHFDVSPQVSVPFNVIVNVRNQSPVPLPSVLVACNFSPMNVLVSGTLPALNGFSDSVITMPVQIDSGGGANMTVNCSVDATNLVPEASESNNFFILMQLLGT